MINASDVELVFGVGNVVRGAAALGSAAVASRAKVRQDRALTERTIAVIKALPAGGEWTESSPAGTSWSVRIPPAQAAQ